MRAIGIDIGSYSIKVAEIEGQPKSTVVRDYKEFELTHEQGQDLRLEKIEILKQITAMYDPRTYRYVVGLGSEFSTSRAVNFPFQERRKILQSLPFELEDMIPFSQSEAIFDFRIINQKTTASKVLAVAVPKKYIQDLLHLCEDGGLSPDIVSLEGVALANHFERFYSTPVQVDSDETVVGGQIELIIHIGYTKTLVNVIQDKSLRASRALYFGGKDMASAVMRAYQLPYLEALKGVAERGFVLSSPAGASEDQVAFSNVISQALQPLVTDLQRTIVDLKSELQVDFSSAHLMGGMSRLINLGPYLGQKLDMTVNVYKHLGFSLRSDIPATEENDKASSVAIGLGIEAFRKPKNPPINLRKNEFSKQNQTVQIFFERYSKVTKMAAAFLLFFYVYSSIRATFTEQNVNAVDKVIKDQAKNPILAMAVKDMKPENLRKIIKSKREEIESRKQVVRLNKMNSALDVIGNISASLPSKNYMTLDVRHFNLDGDHLTLEGVVNNQNELEYLRRSFSAGNGFSNVKVGQSTSVPAQPGKLPFMISMNVQRLPAPLPGEKASSK